MNPRNERSSNVMEEGSRRAIGFHRCYLVFSFSQGENSNWPECDSAQLRPNRHRGRAARGIFNYTPPPQPPTALGVHLYDAIPRFPYQCIRQLKRLLINCHSARPSGAVGASRGNNRKNARPPTRHSMSGQVKSESESINEYIGIFCQKIFDFSTFHFLVPASVIPVRIILLSLLFGIVVL